MGVHFTSYSPQLGVLVLVGLIVAADQDVFYGLRHDWVRPPQVLEATQMGSSSAWHSLQPRAQGHRAGLPRLARAAAEKVSGRPGRVRLSPEPDRPACAWALGHVRDPTRRHTRTLSRIFENGRPATGSKTSQGEKARAIPTRRRGRC
jgi:hypothetical protein